MVKEYTEILYDVKDWVATITINRPKKYNAYTLQTLHEISDAALSASWDDKVGVIVVTGAGQKAFCTGGDVKEYQEKYTQKPRDFWKWCQIFERALHHLRSCGKPVIARLNGLVAGGGNEVQMACDLAVAADHVEIMQVGTRVGSVAAGGATQWLPIIIGDRRAREMLFTCDRISAAQAKDWGLVNEVVPYEKLDEAIAKLVKKILDKFPECLRFTKAQVNFWKDLVWSLTWPSVRDWLSVHFASQEPHEGMTAFVEKRPAEYMRLRQEAAAGKSPEFKWGPWTRSCSKCGAKYLPQELDFCGKCGAKLS
ncbi:MAG: enoyl-CoA hydratase/isomerase family protein [Promethearchaeota archaeon]